MFKSLLSRMALRKLVGLYIGDREATLSQVAVTPLGPVEVSSETVSYQPDQFPEVLAAMLGPLASKRGSAQSSLAIGLPAMRVFFTSRPIQVNDQNASAAVLLHEVIRSTNINVDEMEVDMVRAQPGKRPVASLIACRRKYLSGLLGAVGKCGVRPHRAEPAPFALLRLGQLWHRGPRKARAVVRVFLGSSQGMAVLIVAGLPLGWRTFVLTPGEEPGEVVAAVMSLQVVGRHCGETEPPDVVLIHGRPELSGPLADERFLATLAVKALHFPTPGFDAASVAFGLALGCRQGENSLDLARTLKPRAPLREVIPWGMVAAQAAVLAGLTFLCNSQCEAVREAFRAVRAEGAKHAWMVKVDDQNLEKEKKELEQKITAMRAYLESRIRWSSLTRDAAARLPESIFLRSFTGVCELDMGAKKMGGPKKSMTMKLSAPIPKGEAMPREVDQFLTALRGDADLRKDFPIVELADLKWFQPVAGSATAQAEFTVNCLPKIEKPTPKPPAGEAKSEH